MCSTSCHLLCYHLHNGWLHRNEGDFATYAFLGTTVTHDDVKVHPGEMIHADHNPCLQEIKAICGNESQGNLGVKGIHFHITRFSLVICASQSPPRPHPQTPSPLISVSSESLVHLMSLTQIFTYLSFPKYLLGFCCVASTIWGIGNRAMNKIIEASAFASHAFWAYGMEAHKISRERVDRLHYFSMDVITNCHIQCVLK